MLCYIVRWWFVNHSVHLHKNCIKPSDGTSFGLSMGLVWTSDVLSVVVFRSNCLSGSVGGGSVVFRPLLMEESVIKMFSALAPVNTVKTKWVRADVKIRGADYNCTGEDGVRQERMQRSGNCSGRTFGWETLRQTGTCCQKCETTTTKSLVFHDVSHSWEFVSVGKRRRIWGENAQVRINTKTEISAEWM